VAKPVRNGAIFGSRGFASSSRSTSPCLDVGALGSFALSVIRASATLFCVIRSRVGNATTWKMRPAKALAACKKHRAKLVIAKLDRLSRNLAFIATLMDCKVDFVCCDNPTATKFTLHILAAVAEHERDMISARTKAALAAAKANGKTLGNYQRIAAAKQRATSERAEAARPAIEGTMHLSARAAAEELTRRDIGGKKWHAMQIVRMRRRLGLCDGASRPGRKAGDFEVWA
jgi:hypothetical protein